MKQIIDLFFEMAEKHKDKCAIWCDGKEISYQELASVVTTYANFFVEQGISCGEHVGYPMNNSIEAVAIMLAAAEVGFALVPINATFPKEAVENAFSFANVKHLIARKSFMKQMNAWELDIIEGSKICIDGENEGCISLESAEKNNNRVMNAKNGDEIFIITMTSGSTGNPKPIVLTQNNKLLRAKKHIKLYSLTENDRIMASTPLYHSLAERLVLMPLMLGATSILLPRFTPDLWLNCIEKQKVTVTIAVSAQLAQVAQTLEKEDEGLKLSSLRCLVSSSALLEPQVKSKLISRLKCDFREMYGTSETSTATDICFKESVKKQNSVGKPLDGTEIIMRDSCNVKCEVGVVGEISYKTDLMCAGYYGRRDAFEESFVEGYFKTGDLGYLDEDGYLYYAGRKKEIIITGGINVYPLDVENCVMQIGRIKECAVFSYPDEKLGEVVGLAVVKEGSLDERTIKVHCAKRLADYQQPHYIFFVEELPKNAMGKLVRGKIIEMIKERID